MFAGTYSPNGGPCRGCADGFTTAGPGARSADDCIGTICSQYSIQRDCHPNCKETKLHFQRWTAPTELKWHKWYFFKWNMITFWMFWMGMTHKSLPFNQNYMRITKSVENTHIYLFHNEQEQCSLIMKKLIESELKLTLFDTETPCT